MKKIIMLIAVVAMATSFSLQAADDGCAKEKACPTKKECKCPKGECKCKAECPKQCPKAP